MIVAAMLFSHVLITNIADPVFKERISPQEALSLILGKSIPARPTVGSRIESSSQSFREDGTYEVSFESGFDRGHYAIKDELICASTSEGTNCYIFYRVEDDAIVMVESETGAQKYIDVESLNTSRGG